VDITTAAARACAAPNVGGGARLVVVLDEPDQALLVAASACRCPRTDSAARAPGGRRGACRSRGRSPAAAASTPCPSTPRR
jgi:hypothetical protein